MASTTKCPVCRRRFQPWGPRIYCSNGCQRRSRDKRLAANGGSHTEEQWQALVKKYGRCLCCGDTKAKIYRDHIVPVSRGGTDDISNIQPLCVRCNFRKGNRHATDYRPREVA